MNHRDQLTLEVLRSTAADLQSTLARVNDAIASLQRDAGAPSAVTYVDPRFADCLSRGIPEGHDTVLGHLAKHHPEVLELLDYHTPEATARDGYWLAHRHKTVTYVPAPPVLRQCGILRVRCWPVDLLAERFNPGC